MTTRDPQIAATIQSQIGNGALFMLGAKNLIDHGDGLSFRIRGSKKVNYIKITLDDYRDLYDIEFKKIGRAPNYRIDDVGGFQCIGADQLHNLIHITTGLDVRL